MIGKRVMVRKAGVADAGLLAELGRLAFYQAFWKENSPENMDKYLRTAFSSEKQAWELSLMGSTFFIAETEGTPVGYARLIAGSTNDRLNGSNPIELVRLYVLQDYGRMGIGSLLMQRCIQEASAQQHDTIWLSTWQKNDRGMGFYRKWGFAIVGTKSFQLGDEAQTDWILERAVEIEPLE